MLFSLVVCATLAAIVSSYSEDDPYNIYRDLGPQLSDDAIIYTPSSPQWPNITDRMSMGIIHPDFFASVVAATGKDVEAAVKFANKHHVPFLAHNGGHGAWNDLSDVRGGLQINIRGLNSINVHGNGTATIGGGTSVHEVLTGLAAVNKRTVHGICPCVSLLGPALGGGHGILQGRYGLACDQIVSANVVLANGTAVTASSSMHSDLFWALKGAGHNFGIVTSVEYKVYDILPGSQWQHVVFFFTEDKLEEVFAAANQLTESLSNHPPELMVEWGNLARYPSIDPINPALRMDIIYEGTLSSATPFFTPYEQIGPRSSVYTTSTSYAELPSLVGYKLTSNPCTRRTDAILASVSLHKYNLSTIRSTYETFAALTERAEFNTSYALFESYATNAVKAIDVDSSSVSREERRANLLLGYSLNSLPSPSNRRIAESTAISIANTLRAGQDTAKHGPVGVYPNYAWGTESLSELYGHDKARLTKLRVLKKKWDPKNRFRFYAPIKRV